MTMKFNVVACFVGCLFSPELEPQAGATDKGAERAVLQHGSAAGPAKFSPDGKLLITVTSGELHLWDLASRKRIWHWRPHYEAMSVSLSPDGKTLASAGFPPDAILMQRPRWVVRLWDTTTFKEIRQFKGDESRVDDIAFSPDGR